MLFGCVAHAAAGISEMVELPKEVRETTDSLDACIANINDNTAALEHHYAV